MPRASQERMSGAGQERVPRVSQVRMSKASQERIPRASQSQTPRQPRKTVQNREAYIWDLQDLY